MNTLHNQEQQQNQQRQLELQNAAAQAQKLQEHFEKEVCTSITLVLMFEFTCHRRAP
jgi:FKBP-type peptidyl-prolyl cis-trans isomerase (trigger factor)